MIAGALAMVVALAAATPGASAEAGSLAACRAPTPAPGAQISGFVLLVEDAGALCLAKGPSPKDWIPLRLAAADVAPDRQVLMAAAFSQKLDCRILRRDRGVAVARCWKAGTALRDVERGVEVRNQARAWR